MGLMALQKNARKPKAVKEAKEANFEPPEEHPKAGCGWVEDHYKEWEWTLDMYEKSWHIWKKYSYCCYYYHQFKLLFDEFAPPKLEDSKTWQEIPPNVGSAEEICELCLFFHKLIGIYWYIMGIEPTILGSRGIYKQQ